MQRTTRSKNTRSHGRLVLPLFLLGIAVAGVGFALRERSPAQMPASQVRLDVTTLVNDKGYLGPFEVQAGAFDAVRDEFADFRAETDDLMVGARRARLRVDAELDTIAFEMFDVTIVRVPDDEDDLPVVTRDRYILGPFPYRADIIDDGTESFPVESLTGVLPE